MRGSTMQTCKHNDSSGRSGAPGCVEDLLGPRGGSCLLLLLLEVRQLALELGDLVLRVRDVLVAALALSPQLRQLALRLREPCLGPAQLDLQVLAVAAAHHPVDHPMDGGAGGGVHDGVAERWAGIHHRLHHNDAWGLLCAACLLCGPRRPRACGRGAADAAACRAAPALPAGGRHRRGQIEKRRPARDAASEQHEGEAPTARHVAREPAPEHSPGW
mmetsp:Transcript_144825/g.449588  ORF Transcript_144825/g.449588 Transcript_144825/m.449588 type:complete len:217 (+) Transcript_144825:102-752(+)